MSRTTWAISKKVAGVWTSDSTLNKPNEDTDIQKESTIRTVQLANGSEAFVTPTTKILAKDINFAWVYDDGTMKTKVEAYITAGDSLKITDHNAVIYYGKFIAINSTWLVGIDGDYYDIQATFKIMPSLA